MSSKKIVIAFVPVLHEGYRRFLENHSDAETLYLFGTDVVEEEFPYLQKEIRALEPELMKTAIKSLSLSKDVEVLSLEKLNELSKEDIEIIFPDEDVSRGLAEKFFKDKKITFDKVFLRWDKHKSMEERPVEADQKISKEEFDKEIIQKLRVEAEKSSDWWRRIASAVVKDGEMILVAHNEHLPSQHSPYSHGDPRNTLHKGVGTDIATAIHSEARLIAEAARQGIPLEGASLYVTVFPCSLCAKQIVFSGIKKIYYAGGYQMLDQDKVLKGKGIEIIYVE
ncbi:deoxycytidylate deaminase [Candidatus Parcubacteria bacterium]|nr:deoxycytidylate deaminase [Candidatus Parcubacteria bacterium]